MKNEPQTTPIKLISNLKRKFSDGIDDLFSPDSKKQKPNIITSVQTKNLKHEENNQNNSTDNHNNNINQNQGSINVNVSCVELIFILILILYLF